jgi:hypothetical protein
MDDIDANTFRRRLLDEGLVWLQVMRFETEKIWIS